MLVSTGQSVLIYCLIKLLAYPKGWGTLHNHAGRCGGHDVLVSIVNYRTASHCVACLDSLVAERRSLEGLRVIVADGASGDESVNVLQEWIAGNECADWVHLLPLKINGGFGWAHNQVMLRVLQCDNPPAFMYLLNPDTVLEPGAVSALRQVFEKDPKIGCAGSQMINNQGGIQPAGFRLPRASNEFARGAHARSLAGIFGAKDTIIESNSDTTAIEAVSGASFMVRTAALHKVGLFDTGFFLYFEEFEWMKRFREHGWKIVHVPRSRVNHVGGAATQLSRDRKVLARSARPFYWYQSQRRFMYRTRSLARARFAGLAWGLGYIFLAPLRAAFSRKVRDGLVKNEGKDMLRAWMASDRFDRQAFVPFPGDPVNEPPAWMTRRK